MASGSFYTDIQTGYRLQIDWSSTPNTAANTSSVTADFYLVSTSSGYNISSSSSKTVSITINGVTTSTTATANLTGSQKKLVHTQTTTVSHNSDGTKSCAISGTFSFNGLTINGSTWYDKSTSSTVTLDPIPRASTLTSGQSWTAGGATTFQVNRASTSFYHDVQVEVYNGSAYVNLGIVVTGLATSYTWTPNDSHMTTIFDCLNNDTAYSKGTRITLTTRNGSGTSDPIVGTNVYINGLITAPSASTTTSTANFNIGDNVVIPITRAYSSFIHTLSVYVNNTLIHTSPTGQTTTYTWVPSTSEKTAMYNATTTVKSAASRIEIDTYYDSATTDQIVRTTTTKTGTATVTNSNPTFTTMSYSDYNTTTSALTNPYQGTNDPYIIQNKSQLRGTVLSANKAVGVNQATITKYIATVAGESITINSPFATDINFDFDTIVSSTNQTLNITAYDSRGNSTVVSKTVNVVQWQPPVINSQALRDNGFMDNTVISLSGSIAPCNVNGINVNTIVPASTTWQYRVLGGSYNTATAFLNQTITMPNYTASSVSQPLANTSSWEVLITVTDQLGTNTRTLSVGKGTPIMFIDDVMKSVSIGMFPTKNNSLELFGGIDAHTIDGIPSTSLSVIDSSGTNANGSYIRYTNGLQLCWIEMEVTDQSFSQYSTSALYLSTRAWTFPAAFKTGTVPTAQCSEFKFDTGASWGTISGASTATGTTLRGIDAFSRTASAGVYTKISAMAIGWWK